jgi:hypothetical protein
MKLFSRLLTLSVVCAAMAVNAGHAATAEVGQPAPDFSLTDINGKTYNLSELKGKTVVLEWVNPNCPFVKRHYESGNMPTLQKEAAAEGVVWLSINSGAAGAEGDLGVTEVKKWIGDVNASPAAYFRDQTGKVGRLYGAKTTPHMYVINPEGVLVYQGAIDNNRSTSVGADNYVRAALASVKSGQPVAKKVSEPYGCSVKY